MQFSKKIRERVKVGEITTSIRIWQKPHVKVAGRYKLEEGNIVITSIIEISLDDISSELARDSGFDGIVDLLRTAKHGPGQIVYFIRFYYEDANH
jgi:hypothetical protein